MLRAFLCLDIYKTQFQKEWAIKKPAGQRAGFLVFHGEEVLRNNP